MSKSEVKESLRRFTETYRMGGKQNRELAADEEALQMCAKARLLEEAGDYEQACRALSRWWMQIGERPNLEGLSQAVSAEVLLRVSRLSSWIGNARVIEGGQEIAKDLCSEALTIFEQIRDNEKAAEAENTLAVCYFRNGAFDEARVYLKRASERFGSVTSDLSLTIVVNQAMVERVDDKLPKAHRFLRGIRAEVEKSNNAALKARYSNELGLYFKNTGSTNRALLEFTSCERHLREAGHLLFLARLKNNVGGLKLQIERYAEAHADLQQAEDLFSLLNDQSGAAITLETQARVFLAERMYHEAEDAARRAVSLIEGSSDMAALIENLTTWGISLARLGHYGQARTTFFRARTIALEFIGSKKAVEISLVMLEEVLAPAFGEFEIPLDEGLLRLERRIIQNALEETGDKLTVAGLRLGVTKQNLRYKLKFRHPTLQKA